MRSNHYFSLVLFVVLLLWGPLFNNEKYGLIIRISYLVLIPFSSNYLLLWVWKRFSVSQNFDKMFKMGLSISIGLFLTIRAIYYSTRNYHQGNTLVKMTREGVEELGDNILLPGRDYGIIFICLLSAYFFFRDAFLKKK